MITKKTLIKNIVITTVLIFTILCLAFIYLLNNADDDYEINKNGKELFGEFTLYENTIYVVVPGNGYYPVSLADIKSIHSISNEYYDRHIAIDNKNVYCGNKVMLQMDPKKVESIGNNYYTDGTTTCYCDKATQINKDFTLSKEFRKIIDYYLFNGDKPKKPQTYLYPMRVMPNSDKSYYSLLKNRSIACNGEQVFYKGQLMPKVNMDSLSTMPLYRDDNKIHSFMYFRDGKHVYYKNNLLPIIDNKQLYSIEVNSRKNENYLYNPINGIVYINNFSFDKKKAPYKLMSKFGSHVNHTLWLSKKGVYFYNTEEKEIQRAGDNPFSNNDFKEIAPLVFSNGKETLYIDAYEKWHNSKSDKSLDKRYTTINRLEGLEAKKKWDKLGDYYTYGSVWKHGKHWYYFDKLGERQQVFNPIYKIKDEKTAKKLLTKDIIGSTKIVKQLIREKKLTKPKYKEILKAKTKYDI
ncbi:DKNYY domain-containing protein [Tenacibaculum finnmarkense genomovar ulcerans]|uniref:DKNYY domain-containing protein n=1 Tax=Tenacibaculum finnmarkense TaxID=2781243 RepID=UPI00187B8438|nr:DKNYY domain-containing protein [Tenacibaculum finnmarkense]MBE7693528.1 hypothetical protein [Tenacibaculum finnmarkense genomovar finnmarkense]MCD8454920.1 DKNYY domain-containing protein [Tenacibaculum finnmarkense genomovar ulcerans]